MERPDEAYVRANVAARTPRDYPAETRENREIHRKQATGSLQEELEAK